MADCFVGRPKLAGNLLECPRSRGKGRETHPTPWARGSAAIKETILRLGIGGDGLTGDRRAFFSWRAAHMNVPLRKGDFDSGLLELVEDPEI